MIRGLNLYDFKIYYKATVKMTVWHWHQNGQIDQWTRTEPRIMIAHIYGQIIFYQIAKTFLWRQNSLFNK